MAKIAVIILAIHTHLAEKEGFEPPVPPEQDN